MAAGSFLNGSWSALGATPSKGIGESDAAGLVAIQVTPNNLSTRFTVDAEKDGLSGHQEQTEQPLGRAAIIRTSRIIQAGVEPPISLAIVQPEDGVIFCDLVKDDACVCLPPRYRALPVRPPCIGPP